MWLKFAAGRYLAKLPMEPKLGKMLILGAILGCLDPILTVAAGLSVRDPFLTPLDKKDVSPSPMMYIIKCSSTSYLALCTINWSLVLPKDISSSNQIGTTCCEISLSPEKCVCFYLSQLAEAAKSQFSRDHSDHLALVRAYERYKRAEEEAGVYDYCWKNFLSIQSMRAIDSLRKEFFSLLKDTGLIDGTPATCKSGGNDENLTRAVICYALYPGICSVVVSTSPVLLTLLFSCVHY